MSKFKISVVSYLNSKPFIHGLKESGIMDDIDLQLDIPSVCAQKLLDNKVDVGLIPVAVIPLLKESYIISDYCIGAVGKVASVCLYSQVPLNEIKTILLDYQSRTSVTLVKVLAKEHWNIDPEWKNAEADFEEKIEGNTAAVIIGDRTFGIEEKYPYRYDLAEEWQKLTGLPFVFACWVSNRALPSGFIAQFNEALKKGMEAIDTVSNEIAAGGTYTTDVAYYLKNNISYTFDQPKKQGLELFLKHLKSL
ncbi:MAG: menaquinone biosynthesis protein [Bacteroidetes bacterium]|nr:menaquinone biosynthesis protein [Bacteroidota bacterium]